MKRDREHSEKPLKREPFLVLSVVAAVVAGLLLLDSAVPLLPREAITSLFTGGRGDNTSPSGEVVTRPLSLWEQVFGEYEPEEPDEPDYTYNWVWSETKEPEEDRPWLWESDEPIEDIPVTDPELPVAISYNDPSSVRSLSDQIRYALENIQWIYENQGVDTLLLGLFDFDLDGTPEIVVTTDPDANEPYPVYELVVYDLAGAPLYVFANGDLPQLWVYAQRGQTYPCITSYFHYYEAYESGWRYSEEQMVRFLDNSGNLSVLYGVTQVGEAYTYMQNDQLTDKDGWYGAMEAFEKQYEALGETEMLWFAWQFDMNASEIARQMVTSDQRFVMPFVQPLYEGEVYAYSEIPEGE